MAKERHGIISAGSWTVDRIKLINEWPPEENLAEIVATDRQGGGSGHNLGVDMRKLDASIPVEAIGLVSNDEDGKFLTEVATSAGIDTSQLHHCDNAATSFTDVMSVADTGKRTFFHYRGTHDLLSPVHFDFNQCSGRILHLGLLGIHAILDSPWQQDANGWVTVLKAAQAAGIYTNLELVSIAADKIRRIALPCIPHLNTLIVNEYELSAVSDTSTTDNAGHLVEKLCVKAATRLFNHSSDNNGQLELVVVHSPEAAIAINAERQATYLQSVRLDPTQIKSSVGAGDAFAAGMLYGIHQEWSIDKSLELAHAVAAISLRSNTTVGSVEDVARCLQFAKQMR